MKLLNKKNVLTLEDGTTYKINSPVVNDILNGDYDNAMKYENLVRIEQDYRNHFESLGSNINNYSKGEFLGLFGTLIFITAYGLYSNLSSDLLQVGVASLGSTAGLLYLMSHIAKYKKYDFINSKDYAIYKNMQDFDVAKKCLILTKNDAELQK